MVRRSPEIQARFEYGVHLFLSEEITVKEAAMRVGLSDHSIGEELRRLGINSRYGNRFGTATRPWNNKKEEELFWKQVDQRIATGEPVSVIAENFSVSVDVIKRGWARRHPGEKRPPSYNVKRELTPVNEKAIRLLGDFQWHKMKEIVEQTMMEIPPGAALRWGETRQKQYRKKAQKKGIPEVTYLRKIRELDDRIRFYRYGKAFAILNGNETLYEMRGHGDHREIRLTRRYPPAFYHRYGVLSPEEFDKRNSSTDD